MVQEFFLLFTEWEVLEIAEIRLVMAAPNQLDRHHVTCLEHPVGSKELDV